MPDEWIVAFSRWIVSGYINTCFIVTKLSAFLAGYLVGETGNSRRRTKNVIVFVAGAALAVVIPDQTFGMRRSKSRHRDVGSRVATLRHGRNVRRIRSRSLGLRSLGFRSFGFRSFGFRSFRLRSFHFLVGHALLDVLRAGAGEKRRGEKRQGKKRRDTKREGDCESGEPGECLHGSIIGGSRGQANDSLLGSSRSGLSNTEFLCGACLRSFLGHATRAGCLKVCPPIKPRM